MIMVSGGNVKICFYMLKWSTDIFTDELHHDIWVFLKTEKELEDNKQNWVQNIDKYWSWVSDTCIFIIISYLLSISTFIKMTYSADHLIRSLGSQKLVLQNLILQYIAGRFDTMIACSSRNTWSL